MNDRLLKEFDRKSNHFLRTIRQLIGYKINFNDQEVKLTSESNKDNFLLFKVKQKLKQKIKINLNL